MGWFDKKPNEKDDPAAARPAEGPRPDASVAAAIPATPAAAAPATIPEAEAPRGLAAIFGQRPEGGTPPQASISMTGDAGSVFAESVQIEGSLEGEGDVTLHGQVRGSISITGTLVVTETGRVHADVSAREVVCGGTVEGNIVATDKVRVQGSGLVQGDIDSPSIIIEDGGGVEGFVQMAPSGGEELDEADAMPVAAPPASGRLGRSAPRAPAAHVPNSPAAGTDFNVGVPAASMVTGAMAAAPQGNPDATPQRLTREMLLGLSAPPNAPLSAPPAAGLLNRPLASPHAPAPLPQAATSPIDIFGEDDAPLEAGPLGNVVLGGGNGTDDPLLPDDDFAPEPARRPPPEL